MLDAIASSYALWPEDDVAFTLSLFLFIFFQPSFLMYIFVSAAFMQLWPPIITIHSISLCSLYFFFSSSILKVRTPKVSFLFCVSFSLYV